MPDANRNRTLNEALVILHRSLPMYLSHAAPWVAYGHQHAQQALDRIVADHKEYVRRLSELLDERRHTIDLGEFRMEFTSLHDVDLTYLVMRLIAYQKQEIQALESRARRLSGDPEGQALVEEIVGAARGQLDSLQSLDSQPAIAS